MTEVTLLTREDCDFCEQARGVLERLSAEYDLRIREVSLDSDEGRRMALASGAAIFLDSEPFSYGRLSEQEAAQGAGGESGSVSGERETTIRSVKGLDRRSKRQRESADPVARYLGGLQAEVMAIFWERGSATVREVVDELNKRRRLAYTTVLTLVSRLWSRGLLTRDPEGRGFRYRPAKTREEFLRELSDELIDRLVADFGEIGVARLGERLEQLDPGRVERLRRARKGR